ncbi:hypothetical protein [Mesorhizobium marinum]|uniref:hypothetical protein n=1 Tax=Mesorhizobium marinum TaxID=3228790 RepID=UPI003466421F
MTGHPNIITGDEILVSAAVWHVRRARNHLHAAQTNVDDAGFSCEALTGLYADAAVLVAHWHGRPVPDVEPVPALIAEAAVEWRRSKRRRY